MESRMDKMYKEFQSTSSNIEVLLNMMKQGIGSRDHSQNQNHGPINTEADLLMCPPAEKTRWPLTGKARTTLKFTPSSIGYVASIVTLNKPVVLCSYRPSTT